ncbi:X2-like carbohydrate binding domain-containing protein [Paenibacillus sp. R14(2021)]|uniref:X2-like carbohydrate binding domain-containing protein n=1 Tax=Paenibacillus sp. R14(2021) TaxID=2859228 RepID=UPI0021574C8F|nr:X2-like carbohydrate binding domain-containing protein [Paenibacillus sp. R14(2021)]
MIQVRAGRTIRLWVVVALLIVAQLGVTAPRGNTAHAANNGLGAKPYMGWSSYSMQVYSGNSAWITAAQIKAQSDAMHTTLQSHGYEYINIDAGWNGGIDGYGRPVPSTTLYPNGLGDVIDYVHNNGQKIGLYMIPGLSPQAYNDDLPIYNAPGCSMQDIAVQPLTTADYWNLGYKIDFSNPCAQKYINSIADLLASWGVDFLKFDSVTPGSGHNDTTIDARGDVAAWSQALAPHGIWFELSWALDHNYVDTWKQYANGWRVDWDVECYCTNSALTSWPNIARLFPDAATWWRDAGPGGWNDFDSLNVGNGAMDGLTQDERRTAMTLWAMSSAQLYTGNDLTNLDSFGISLLTNDEVIAVNQAGRPAHPVSMDTDQQVWYANNGDGSYTVGLFNLASSAATVNVNWSDIGLSGSGAVRDLWSHTDLGTFAAGYSSVNLPSHGSRLFKVTAQGGTVTANDDDQDFRYTGSWSRNGGQELAAASQNLVIEVGDTSTLNSAIQPAQASFNKKTTAQTDISAAMTLNGNTLSGITNGGASLTAGTDYTLSGSQVTIKKSYLAAQPVGTTSLVFAFSAGSPVTLSVVVTDTTNGVVSSYNDDDAAIAYTGVWQRSSGRGLGDYHDDVHYTESNNASFEFGFTGTGASLITEKDTSQGDIDVYVDNVFQQTVSTYNASRLVQQNVFSVTGLAEGAHTLKAVKKSGSFMLLDRLDVTAPDLIIPAQASFNKKASAQADVSTTITPGSPSLNGIANNGTVLVSGTDYTVTGGDVTIKKAYLAAQPVGMTRLTFSYAGGASQTLAITVQDTSVQTLSINDSDAGIAYTGSWGYSWSRGLGDYNDDVHYTENNNDSFQYAFTGTGIELITEKDSSQGDIDIYLDNVFQQTVSTYNASRLTQQSVFSAAGLADAPHTLKVVKKSGSYMLLDRLKATIVSASQNSTVSPSAASFDIASQADVTAALSLNGNTLTSVSLGVIPLSPTTDYSISGNQLTLKKEYLATLAEGTYSFFVSFSGGDAQQLVIAVTDSARGRYLSVNDDNAQIAYSGSWGTSRGRGLGDYNDDVHYAETNGAYFEYAFTGTGIELITEKDASQGDVDVYVDGTLQKIISTYRDGRQVQQLAYKAAGLTDGAHTLKVVKRSGSYMLLDRLKVRLSDLINPDAASFDKKVSAQADVIAGLSVDTSSLVSIKDGSAILTAGSDYTVSGSQVTIKKSYLASKPAGRTNLAFAFRGDYKDDIHAAMVNNDAFTFAFKGTGIELLGPKGPNLGNIDIYVDNVLKTTISAYNGARTTEQSLYSLSGLTNAPHVIKGVKKSGSVMLVDKARFTVPAKVVVNDTNTGITYSSGWTLSSGRGFGDYQDDVHIQTGNTPNPPFFQYSFTGTGIEIITEKDAAQGLIKVFVDNVLKETIDTSNPSRQVQQAVYEIQNLPPGSHTLKVLKQSGTNFLLDALRITP